MKRAQYYVLILVSCLVSVHASGVTVCSVSSTGTAFGVFDTISGSDKNVVGTISVTCSGNTGDTVSYTIALSPGGTGSFAARDMQTTGAQIGYNLYTDAGHNFIWGDGSSGTSTVSDSYQLPATSNTVQYSVYGQIPGSGQSGVPAGSFNDNIVVTVNYN